MKSIVMKSFLISFFLLCVSFSVVAATNSVTTTPTTTTHMVGSSTPINFSWVVTGSAGTHTSTVGTFRATTGNKGPSLGSTINTAVNVGCFAVGAGVSCSPQTEVVTIPADVITTIEEAGLSTIFYNRTFSDGFAATGSIQINLITIPVTPPSPPPPVTPTANSERTLSITRETLRFSDHSTVKFTKPNSQLSAVAELKFTGTGLLDAFWEYATPSSTTGRPIFIRLNTVRRYLGAGGRVILQSPPLPSDTSGQYLVRLQILKTLSNPNGVEFTDDLPAGLPILRYTIGRKGNGEAGYSLPPIKTLLPKNNAYLEVNTRFNWQAVKNAKAYQLELYLPDTNNRPVINPSTNVGDGPVDGFTIGNNKPSSGLLIPATKTSLALSTLSRDELKRGKTYYWRIIAIGTNGQILTTSTLKEIRTP